MRFESFLGRLDKFSQVIQSPRLSQALLRHRVLAGAEHRGMFPRTLQTVVDIGANRGQFSLAVREWVPEARVISFEPLPGPASIFRRVFAGDDRVILHEAAVGPRRAQMSMHVSGRDDSSSLLPISSVQTTMFPATEEVARKEVRVGPLDEFISADDLRAPAMLKLDVQGYEYEALTGCDSLLSHFDLIYCECSFLELYSGQRLAWELIDWLSARGYKLTGVFNPSYGIDGQAIQADFLFTRPNAGR